MRFVRNFYNLVFFISICNAAYGMDASYIITPRLTDIIPTIQVKLEIITDEDGVATLVYMDEAWGEKSLFKCLSSVKVLNTNAEIKIVPELNKIFIHSEPSHLLEIEYILLQDFNGEANVSDYYRPIINEKYFHLFGHRLFLIPEKVFSSQHKNAIEINWEEVPYLVHHNFGTESEGVYNLTRDELLESVIVGGDFRRMSVEFNGINLYLLTRGKWKNFTDKELLLKLESIVNIQRDFWNDYSDNIYTVTLLSLSQSDGAYIGGTGLSKGFASFCSNSRMSKLENLSSLYYHEIMHHWIGGKIRNSTVDKELWFSEGFTEYFSLKLMEEQKEISKSDFINTVEQTYQDLSISKYVNYHNDDLNLTSSNSQLEQIPYQRGLIYAHYLDRKLNDISEDNITLKSIMLRILKDSENQSFSNLYFKNILMEFFPSEELDLFDQYIIKGNKLPKLVLDL